MPWCRRCTSHRRARCHIQTTYSLRITCRFSAGFIFPLLLLYVFYVMYKRPSYPTNRIVLTLLAYLSLICSLCPHTISLPLEMAKNFGRPTSGYEPPLPVLPNVVATQYWPWSAFCVSFPPEFALSSIFPFVQVISRIQRDPPIYQLIVLNSNLPFMSAWLPVFGLLMDHSSLCRLRMAD